MFLASERTLSSLKSSALTPRDRRKNSYQAANLHSRLRRCCICGRFFRLYIPRAKTLKWRQLRAQRHCRKHHHLPLHSILCGSGPKKKQILCPSRTHLAVYSYSTMCTTHHYHKLCSQCFFSCSHRKSYKGHTIMGKKLRYVLYFRPFGLVHQRYSYSWPT